jgi:gliding motility-associated-like protein
VVWVFAESGTVPNCTAESSFTVTINQTPVIAPIADVVACDSYTLPALPAGQEYHSASGGASPMGATPTIATAGANQVFVFAHTGTVPDCTAESSFTVTINQTPVIVPVADVAACDSYTLPALPAGQEYHSAPGGASPMGATPTITGQGLHQVWVYQQTGTTPNCWAETSFGVTINDTPVIADPADVVACDSYTLPDLGGQGDYFSGPNGGGTPYLAGDVITSSMTMYVWAQTGTVPNCTAQNDFTIGIFFSPAVNTPTPLEVCDDNNDGFQCGIDLTTKTVEVTGGDPALTASFHETLIDAQNGVTAIPNPASYCNIVAGEQTVYVRVFDASAPLCASVAELTIRVNPVPVAAIGLDPYRLCDVNDPGNGIETFDLTSMEDDIVGAQVGVAVTYYLDQAAAQNGVAGTEIGNPSAFDNTVVGAPQTIWVRLEYGTGCFGVGSFEIIVDPLPLVVDPTPMNACSDGITGTASFNLSSKNFEISGAVPGVIVSYYASLADAQGEVNPLPNPYVTASTTVYVRVEDAATGCYDTTSLELIVTDGPPTNAPSPLQVCDPNNDCFAGFDLTGSYADIVGVPTPLGIEITFHETLTDAQNGVTAIADPTDYTNIVACDQVVYVRVEYTATGCFSIEELALHVNLTPQGTEIAPLEVCDEDTDGIGTFDLTTATPQILGSLDPAQHTVTYHLDLASAQNDTGAITTVLAFASPTATIFVRVEDNTTGCFDIIELELIVNPLPLVPAGGAAEPYSLCDVDNPGDEVQEFDLCSQIPGILNGQLGMEVTFHLSQADADGDTGALPCLYSNPSGVNPQTLHVRIENTDTGCYVTTTMDIRVEPLPSPIPPSGPIVGCDQDGDGFATFDLEALVPAMLQGEVNTDITFHLTQQDAENGVLAIDPADAYINDNPFVDFVYVRAFNTVLGCQSVIMIELNVIASPVVPSDLGDLTLCDEDADDQDGLTAFDLTLNEQQILDAQTVQPADPSGYVITYHTTQADAEAGTGAIILINGYINTSNPQTIWVRVEGVNGGCYNVGSFDLIVNTPLAPAAPALYALCDDDTASPAQTSFDLTLMDGYFTGGLAGYQVDYFVTQAERDSGVSSIADYTAFVNSVAGAQTLFVAVTGPGTSTCRSFTTLTVRVLPLPQPNTTGIEPIHACDDDQSAIGTEPVDLTLNEDLIRDNDPSLAFGYYPTQQDAVDQANQIATPTAYAMQTGSVWIRIDKVTANGQDIDGNYCYVIIEQPVVIDPLPVVPAAPYLFTVCDADNDGVEQVVFTQDIVPGLLALQATGDYTVSFHAGLADAQGGTAPLADAYQVGPADEVVYVRIGNDVTGCVNTAELTLHVAAGANATQPADYADCDDDTDGELALDLNTLFDAQVLGGQDATLFTVAYFESQADALSGTAAVSPADAYVTGTATLWAVVTNTATGCRSEAVAVNITVEPLADPVITSDTGKNVICVDYVSGALLSGLTLSTGLDPSLYSFEWFLGGGAAPVGTGPTYTVTDPAGYGDYTVVATSLSALGCVSAPSPAFTVVLSGPASPVGQGYIVSGAFSDDQTITVTVEGHGQYLYALDGGPWLDNGGVFVGVSAGEHTVAIRNVEGGDPDGGDGPICDDVTIGGIMAINYPHYFTPNGDGYHDTWNIIGLEGQRTAKIYIFDRYGKLLKQLSPSGDSQGWDGTYNGRPLPSTDYWFSVQFLENDVSREFKAHFSLKR